MQQAPAVLGHDTDGRLLSGRRYLQPPTNYAFSFPCWAKVKLVPSYRNVQSINKLRLWQLLRNDIAAVESDKSVARA